MRRLTCGNASHAAVSALARCISLMDAGQQGRSEQAHEYSINIAAQPTVRANAYTNVLRRRRYHVGRVLVVNTPSTRRSSESQGL